jgi:hypothetical protein
MESKLLKWVGPIKGCTWVHTQCQVVDASMNYKGHVADIYPWLKVFGEKDIGWLHISMDDRAAAAILKIIQCFCDT